MLQPFLLLTRERRQIVTRTLCWLLIATTLLIIPIWATAIAAFWVGDSHLLRLLTFPSFLAFLLQLGVGIVLAVWRSCDCCGFHVYPFAEPVGLFSGMVRRSKAEERLPDSRAERFIGAWGWGAVVSMATKGTAHCVWCGHADGAKLPTE